MNKQSALGIAPLVLMAVGALLWGMCVASAGAAFDPRPYLEDLDQVHDIFSTKYALFEWAVFDREADLPAMFAETRRRIEHAHSEYEARVAFDHFARVLEDEHMGFVWPRAGAAAGGGSAEASPPCADYAPSHVGDPIAALAPGYRALPTPGITEFPAGIIETRGARVGVLQLGLFDVTGFPALCDAALAALNIAKDKPCNDACGDRIENWAYGKFTRDFAGQLRNLKSAGADVLLIDLSGDGGGTEWSDAAVRMVTARAIKALPVRVARGQHWAKKFSDAEAELRKDAKNASPADRNMLLGFADRLEAKRRDVLTPCDSSPLWRGEHPHCALLAQGFYESGLVASADPASLRGKPWAATMFSPMQYPYEEGVWRGPLILLIDEDTGSAASRFAALIQDNRAGVVMGVPATAGGGHTDGGTPTVLRNTKAIVEVPDFAGFRLDGTNEARGIEPDVLVGYEPAEGRHLRAARFLAKLPAAVEAARAVAQ